MGSWFSSEEVKIEEKAVDSNGVVNNNIIIQEARDTHTQVVLNERLLMATYFLCFMECIRLILIILSAYKKSVKKRFSAEKNGSP